MSSEINRQIMSETNRQVAGTTVDPADFGSSLYL
jgi:hypothetical protein